MPRSIATALKLFKAATKNSSRGSKTVKKQAANLPALCCSRCQFHCCPFHWLPVLLPYCLSFSGNSISCHSFTRSNANSARKESKAWQGWEFCIAVRAIHLAPRGRLIRQGGAGCSRVEKIFLTCCKVSIAAWANLERKKRCWGNLDTELAASENPQF